MKRWHNKTLFVLISVVLCGICLLCGCSQRHEERIAEEGGIKTETSYEEETYSGKIVPYKEGYLAIKNSNNHDAIVLIDRTMEQSNEIVVFENNEKLRQLYLDGSVLHVEWYRINTPDSEDIEIGYYDIDLNAQNMYAAHEQALQDLSREYGYPVMLFWVEHCLYAVMYLEPDMCVFDMEQDGEIILSGLEYMEIYDNCIYFMDGENNQIKKYCILTGRTEVVVQGDLDLDLDLSTMQYMRVMDHKIFIENTDMIVSVDYANNTHQVILDKREFGCDEFTTFLLHSVFSEEAFYFADDKDLYEKKIETGEVKHMLTAANKIYGIYVYDGQLFYETMKNYGEINEIIGIPI